MEVSINDYLYHQRAQVKEDQNKVTKNEIWDFIGFIIDETCEVDEDSSGLQDRRKSDVRREENLYIKDQQVSRYNLPMYLNQLSTT